MKKPCKKITQSDHSISPQKSAIFAINAFRFGWLTGTRSPVVSRTSIPSTLFTYERFTAKLAWHLQNCRCVSSMAATSFIFL